eukprot:CAMPEP_0172457070 /NCGR_PEP_ID=MMETSP1065-20121228/19764_1 /TAXON_ID=265537 /ORGANISM="Amphiprora paludosa, Strain CCMP125" /LENGTH=303 /DNA_ID=CAMNT_0013210551 /DNA_START=121 /DNA_END=1032 /DNA_ORIENTATION=+
MVNFPFTNKNNQVAASGPSSIISAAPGKQVLTVDIVPGSMAKPMVEPDHANQDARSTQSTIPATIAAEEEDLTEGAFDDHSKEGGYLSGPEGDDDTLGENDTVREEDFLRDILPLGRDATGRLPRAVSASILKTSSTEMHISDKRRSWKCLPKPDLVKIRAQSCPTTRVERVAAEEKKNVKFHMIEVRNYSQTLGDNPSCSYGPPISLDWDYEEGGEVEVEDYEANRGPRRKLRHMMMNYYQRKNILQWKVGCSEDELKKAQKSAERIKSQRALTRAMLPALKVEQAMESLGRKARRALKGKN